MLSSSLNTGSTDLRDTDVQQPNTAATLSLLISSRAFSANSGQLDAGSTTIGSTFLPNSPPFLLSSATCISMRSFRIVSLIAIVPESECKIPILMVSSAALLCAVLPRRSADATKVGATQAGATQAGSQECRTVFIGSLRSKGGEQTRQAARVFTSAPAVGHHACRGGLNRDPQRKNAMAPE